MKYIVKNCPCANKYECLFCVQNKDCPIRQVVEVCLRYYPVSLIRALQDEILQILQVEKVE